MKKFVSKILVAPLLVVYLTAVAGVTIHECTVDRTTELLGLLAEQTAECPHSHRGCPQDSEAGGHHHGGVSLCEGKCCHDSIYALEQAQRTSDDDYSKLTLCTTVLLPSPAPLAPYAAAMPLPALKAEQKGRCAASGKAILTLYSVQRA